MIQGLIRALLVLCMLAPILLLIGRIEEVAWPPFHEWGFVFWQTFTQAFLSALFSLVLGGVGVLGLLRLRGRSLICICLLCLLPNFIPQIFVLTAIFQWADTLAFPLSGLSGIVIVHVLINSGVCAVALHQLILAKMGRMGELALTEGASRTQFFLKGVIPYLKVDIVLIALLVFGFCFTSFGIPLIVGGVSATTLEVLIYEKIKMNAQWAEALFLVIVQSLVLFVLFLPMRRQKSQSLQKTQSMHDFGWSMGVWPVIFITLSLLVGLLVGVPEGIVQAREIPNFISDIFPSMAGSFRIAMNSGVFTFVLLNLLAFALPHYRLKQFFNGYLAPSPAVFGLALWLVGPNGGWVSELKIAVSLSLITLPALFRWQFSSLMSSLEGQMVVAKSMGAKNFYIYKKIVWPQMAKTALLLSGISAFWASGDFAMSTILAYGNQTLGLLTESLLVSYRMELASLVAWLMLVLGAVIFSIFGGLAFVVDRKPVS